MNSFLKGLNGSRYTPISQKLGSDYCCSGKCSKLLQGFFVLVHLLAHRLDAIQCGGRLCPKSGSDGRWLRLEG
jgi:hypothetical protein